MLGKTLTNVHVCYKCYLYNKIAKTFQVYLWHCIKCINTVQIYQ